MTTAIQETKRKHKQQNYIKTTSINSDQHEKVIIASDKNLTGPTDLHFTRK